ncbi:hypothetical protein PIB30_008628 [Stylosanthes scabra]|uniref:Uncharacterized protein n=1 Tax=Stylosanthes scabra TaxID=79078 RepID=A0ABU6S5B6_9FABA|nr:hypothetical protein [Stylosanthes scabra]
MGNIEEQIESESEGGSESESEPDLERTISQDENIQRNQSIPMQPSQNEEVNPQGENERRSKKRNEVNVAAVQPPQHQEDNPEGRNKRRLNLRYDVNAVAGTQPHAAAAATSVIEPPNNSEINVATAINVDPAPATEDLPNQDGCSNS